MNCAPQVIQQLANDEYAPMVLRLEEYESLRFAPPPPGLDFPPGLELPSEWTSKNDIHASLESGLPAKIVGDISTLEAEEATQLLGKGLHDDGVESEDTGFGSEPTWESSMSSHSDSEPADADVSRCIRLSDGQSHELSQRSSTEGEPAVNTFPSDPSANSIASKTMDDEKVKVAANKDEKPIQRTKLTSKSAAFVPLPFVPMAEVVSIWQRYEAPAMHYHPSSHSVATFGNFDGPTYDTNFSVLPVRRVGLQ